MPIVRPPRAAHANFRPSHVAPLEPLFRLSIFIHCSAVRRPFAAIDDPEVFRSEVLETGPNELLALIAAPRRHLRDAVRFRESEGPSVSTMTARNPKGVE